MPNQFNNKTKPVIDSYFEEETMSLSDIVLLLARQLKIIIIIPTILSVFTIIYVLFFTKPIYKSTAKIISSSSGVRNSQASGLAAQFGINIPNSQSEPKWVYDEIIKSRTLAKAVLKQKFDTNEFGPQKTLLQILTYGNNKPKFKNDTLQILGIERLLGMVEVNEDVKTSILTLSINASESNLARDINRVFIEQLDAHQKRYNKAKTIDARKFIEERIVDTESELVKAEEDLKIFMDRNRRIENSPALQLEQQRIAREVTVLTGVYTTLKQQLETTKIEEVKESAYVIVLDPPEAPLKISKPNKKLMILLAGFLGIGLGIIIGLINELLLNGDKKQKEKLNEAKYLIIKNLLELVSIKNKLLKK